MIPTLWLMSAQTLDAAWKDRGSRAALIGRSVYVGVPATGTSPVHTGVTIIPTVHYESEVTLAADVGTLPPGWWPLFDCENWTATPLIEQEEPYQYAQLAAEAAHAAGRKLWQTPAMDLLNVGHPAGTKNFSVAGALALVTGIAPWADALDIQAQGFDGDPTAYASFVTEMAAAARGAHPGIVLAAGISTARGGTPHDWARCVAETATLVDGYWMNVPDGNYSAAQEFFALVAKL